MRVGELPGLSQSARKQRRRGNSNENQALCNGVRHRWINAGISFASGQNIFDDTVSTCTGTNCSSLRIPATIFAFGPSAGVYTIDAFASPGQCVRFDLISPPHPAPDMELVVVAPNGSVFRNDDRNGAFDRRPLVKSRRHRTTVGTRCTSRNSTGRRPRRTSCSCTVATPPAIRTAPRRPRRRPWPDPLSRCHSATRETTTQRQTTTRRRLSRERVSPVPAGKHRDRPPLASRAGAGCADQ